MGLRRQIARVDGIAVGRIAEINLASEIHTFVAQHEVEVNIRKFN